MYTALIEKEDVKNDYIKILLTVLIASSGEIYLLIAVCNVTTRLILVYTYRPGPAMRSVKRMIMLLHAALFCLQFPPWDNVTCSPQSRHLVE